MGPTPRSVDVVVLGATGFTGKLACEYLSAYKSPVRWVAAARSPTRLAALAKELGLSEDQTRVVDCTDSAAMSALASECSCIANFAGTPFLDKALPVVEACVAAGTSYIDITGEVPLQKASYMHFHEQAQQTGSLVLHGCGYDSIPSDLGAFMASSAIAAEFGVQTVELKSFAGPSKGGISGGTLATALMMSGLSAPGPNVDVSRLPGVAEVKASGGVDPLRPRDDDVPAEDGGSGLPIGFDRRLRSWHQPFIMAGVNAPVVRKSARLLGYGGGDGRPLPKYSEVQQASSLLGAIGGTAGLVLSLLLVALAPVRNLLFALKVLPRPGEGPSKELRDQGFFQMTTLGVGGPRNGDTGRPPMVVAEVKSGVAGDPGYKATAHMAIEAALTIALNRERCTAASSGGVLTPASALGMALVDRLNDSGMELRVCTFGDGAEPQSIPLSSLTSTKVAQK